MYGERQESSGKTVSDLVHPANKVIFEYICGELDGGIDHDCFVKLAHKAIKRGYYQCKHPEHLKDYFSGNGRDGFEFLKVLLSNNPDIAIFQFVFVAKKLGRGDVCLELQQYESFEKLKSINNLALHEIGRMINKDSNNVVKSWPDFLYEFFDDKTDKLEKKISATRQNVCTLSPTQKLIQSFKNQSPDTDLKVIVEDLIAIGRKDVANYLKNAIPRVTSIVPDVDNVHRLRPSYESNPNLSNVARPFIQESRNNLAEHIYTEMPQNMSAEVIFETATSTMNHGQNGGFLVSPKESNIVETECQQIENSNCQNECVFPINHTVNECYQKETKFLNNCTSLENSACVNASLHPESTRINQFKSDSGYDSIRMNSVQRPVDRATFSIPSVADNTNNAISDSGYDTPTVMSNGGKSHVNKKMKGLLSFVSDHEDDISANGSQPTAHDNESVDGFSNNLDDISEDDSQPPGHGIKLVDGICNCEDDMSDDSQPTEHDTSLVCRVSDGDDDSPEHDFQPTAHNKKLVVGVSDGDDYISKIDDSQPSGNDGESPEEEATEEKKCEEEAQILRTIVVRKCSSGNNSSNGDDVYLPGDCSVNPSECSNHLESVKSFTAVTGNQTISDSQYNTVIVTSQNEENSVNDRMNGSINHSNDKLVDYTSSTAFFDENSESNINGDVEEAEKKKVIPLTSTIVVQKRPVEVEKVRIWHVGCAPDVSIAVDKTLSDISTETSDNGSDSGTLSVNCCQEGNNKTCVGHPLVISSKEGAVDFKTETVLSLDVIKDLPIQVDILSDETLQQSDATQNENAQGIRQEEEPDRKPGQFVLIANSTFKHSIKRRIFGARKITNLQKGTLYDQKTIEQLFKDHGFRTYVFQNRSVDDILAILADHADDNHVMCNGFVCCILSQGVNGNICDKELNQLDIENIIKVFDGSTTLSGKPKLFIVRTIEDQECSVEKYKQGEEGEEDETYIFHSKNADIEKAEGSSFINDVCKIIEKCSKGDIRGMVALLMAGIK